MGGGQNLPYTNWKSVEKAVKKNKKIIFSINFLFIYLRISKFLLTFAS